MSLTSSSPSIVTSRRARRSACVGPGDGSFSLATASLGFGRNWSISQQPGDEAKIERSVGEMARTSGLPAGWHTFQWPEVLMVFQGSTRHVGLSTALYLAALVWEEHDCLIVRITIGVQGVKHLSWSKISVRHSQLQRCKTDSKRRFLPRAIHSHEFAPKHVRLVDPAMIHHSSQSLGSHWTRLHSSAPSLALLCREDAMS